MGTQGKGENVAHVSRNIYSTADTKKPGIHLKTGEWHCGTSVANFCQQAEQGKLAFLTPPFLGGFSAEVGEISPHNSNVL
jgi:hypothetical protein